MPKRVVRIPDGAVAAASPALAAVSASADEPLRLFAAGSLKSALAEIAGDFQLLRGGAVRATFGAAGLLRRRLEQGEAADLFASANTEHPRALNEAGLAGPVRVFARNRLCALVLPQVSVTSETLLDRMLDPAVRVGTSTPKADPSGDYAWALFGKADALRPGSAAALRAKALQLTGGPDSPKPPDGRNTYAWVMEQGRADIFLTYRTNAMLAAAEMPGLQVVELPESLAVGAVYGLAVMKGGNAAGGEALADHILSPAGRAVLDRYGFPAP